MEKVFLNLFNISIMASYLIIVIILIRIIFKKIPKWICCILWGIVGIRLCFPFSIESVMSLLPASQIIDPSIGTSSSTFDPNYFIDNSTNTTLIHEINHSANLQIYHILTYIWLIGMILMMIYCFISYYKIYRKVSISILYQKNIYFCDEINTPFILGIINPKIYLPSSIEKQIIPYVLEHERAHLKRKDQFIKPFGYLLLCIYWMNPLVWIAYILLCRDIESACDEKVIQKKDNTFIKGYSKALLDCSVSRKMIMVCPLAFGEVSVKQRIKSILNYKNPSFWVIVLSLALCMIIAISFLTIPKSEISDFSIKTNFKGKVELTSSQQEQLIQYLDEYQFNSENKTTIDTSQNLFAIDYVKDEKNYTWYITQDKIALFIHQKDNIIEFSGSDNQLFETLKKYQSVNEEIDYINNQEIIYSNESSLNLSKTILNHYEGANNLAYESHIQLAFKMNSSSISEYLLVLYQEFQIENNELKIVRNIYEPTIITYSKNGDEYIVTDYWTSSSDLSKKEIQDKFQSEIVGNVLNKEKYLKVLEDAIQLDAQKDLQTILVKKENIQLLYQDCIDFISLYNNGYTDEDYNAAEGEICLHPRGEFIFKDVSVYISSDPHRLFCYIVKIEDSLNQISTKIYMDSDNYEDIKDYLLNQGFVYSE
ncbi:MAG: M56 family metallopeptidase [Traorella sp.]